MAILVFCIFCVGVAIVFGICLNSLNGAEDRRQYLCSQIGILINDQLTLQNNYLNKCKELITDAFNPSCNNIDAIRNIQLKEQLVIGFAGCYESFKNNCLVLFKEMSYNYEDRDSRAYDLFDTNAKNNGILTPLEFERNLSLMTQEGLYNK